MSDTGGWEPGARPSAVPGQSYPWMQGSQATTGQQGWGSFNSPPVGATPMPYGQFCAHCGTPNNPLAPLCVRCGAPSSYRGSTWGAKSKTASVLLAVFLSFWTWLYTFRQDSWKFFVGLAVDLVFGFLGIIFLPFWIVNFGIWVWAIVDTAVKPQSFYDGTTSR